MGAGAQPVRFGLQPLSRRAGRLVRQRRLVLYAVSACLGAIVYLYFRVDIRPDLERAGHWSALGLFDLKEHFVCHRARAAPGLLGVLATPAIRTNRSRTPAALTLILAFIVWWSFLMGHVLNNIMGFGL